MDTMLPELPQPVDQLVAGQVESLVDVVESVLGDATRRRSARP